MKKCWSCKQFLPTEAFNKCKNKKDGLQDFCRECGKAYNAKNKERFADSNRERRKLNVQSKMLFVLQYLEGKSCIDCGENNPRVLEFDHVRGHKTKEICKLIQSCASIKRILDEISKCEIRCRNCHRRKTHKEFSHYNYIDLNNLQSTIIIDKKFVPRRGQRQLTEKEQLERNNDRVKMKRIFVLQELEKRGCIDCGEKDPTILEFDHISGTKRFGIGRMVSKKYSFELIKEEMGKCEVRCCNCHILKTSIQLGHYKYIDFTKLKS